MADASLPEQDPIAALKSENARLVTLLERHGIDWRRPSALPPAPTVPRQQPLPARLTTAEKLSMLHPLSCGRTDIYPVHWENRLSGRQPT
ncbi:hypothetical protein [Azohydromonas australica]|uniref:hypothetical protein n=1 Tax=Azohydromonas australica TaxID=364039 RepID=UPI00041362ED|nr:hypothetical protein [Azohydromonas australica]